MQFKLLTKKINSPTFDGLHMKAYLLLIFVSIFAYGNVSGQAVCVPDLTHSVVSTGPNASMGSNGGNFTVNAIDIDNGSTGSIVGVSFDPVLFPFGSQSATGNCSSYATNEVVVYLFAADANGAITSCGTTVEIMDNSSPQILCFPNVQISLDATGSVTVTENMLAQTYENCNLTNFEIQGGDQTYTCVDVGSSPTVTLLATDDAGNSVTSMPCTFTIIDNTSPTAICKNTSYNTSSLLGATTGSINIGDVNNGSTVNCGIPNLALSQTTFTCADAGSIIPVTLTVSDNQGNSATCLSQVSIFDDMPPSLGFISNSINVNLDASGLHTLVGADVANASTTIDDCAPFANLTWSFTPSILDCDDIGTSVAVTVTDEFNNSTSGTVIVSAVDNIAPVAICTAQTISLNLDANGTASLTPMMVDNGSTDNCPNSINMSLSQTMYDCNDIGTSTVTLTVSDMIGSSITIPSQTCTANVEIFDNIPPTVICEDITIDYSTTIIPGDVTTIITDNCSVDLISLSQSTFSCSDLGTNSISVNVTDVAGNATVCTANVTVEDNISPIASAQNITVDLDASGNIIINPFDANNGSMDACDNSLNFSVLPASFDCNDLGTQTATLIVTDDSGNSQTAPFAITVEDNILPTVSCQMQTESLDASGTLVVNAIDFVAASNDNCSIANTEMSLSEFGSYTPTLPFNCNDVNSSPIDIYIKVTDNSNNTEICTTALNLVAGSMPVAISQDITIVLDANGMKTISHTDVDNGSSGICGLAVTLSKYNFDCNDIGTQPITLTATDAFGNTATDISIITIEDNTNPTLTIVPKNDSFDSNGEYILDPTTMASFTDNCGATLVTDKVNFTCSDAGANLITFTVTDAAGNSNVGSSTLTLSDTQAPTLLCNNDVTVDLDPVNADATLLPNQIYSSFPIDNCSSGSQIVSTITSQTMFTCTDFLNQPTPCSLFVTDAAGNSTVACTSNLIVDNPPLVLAKPAGMIPVQKLDGDGNFTLSPALIDDGSIAACELGVLSVNPSTFNCSNLGVNEITLTYTLPNGDFDEATTEITIEVDPLFPNPCDPCPTVVFADNSPIFNGIYNADNTVNSEGQITGSPMTMSNDVIFNAGTEINLEPGFYVDKLANFKANIQDCID